MLRCMAFTLYMVRPELRAIGFGGKSAVLELLLKRMAYMVYMVRLESQL